MGHNVDGGIRKKMLLVRGKRWCGVSLYDLFAFRQFYPLLSIIIDLVINFSLKTRNSTEFKRKRLGAVVKASCESHLGSKVFGKLRPLHIGLQSCHTMTVRRQSVCVIKVAKAHQHCGFRFERIGSF